ncbi:MAG: hypothetical protein Kow0025_15080 [Thermodesulfovibrionales bacterium]
MARNLLFVTSRGDTSDDGFLYALDLARITRRGVTVLMVYRKKLAERLERLMSATAAAVAFAEANEYEAAREVLEDQKFEKVEGKVLNDIRRRCRESGVEANVVMTSDNFSSALNSLLKQDGSIDMVLLSPDVTGNGGLTLRDLKKLLKSVSMPIVTLSRTDKAHGTESAEAA